MVDIRLNHLVYKTCRETTAIYTAEYMGEPCYAIVHDATGFVAIIDYDKRALESMKRFMHDKGYTLSYDKDPSGLPRYRFMNVDDKRDRVDLRQFLFARYNKRRLSSMGGRVCLRQDDREENFCDLRRYNLYMPGECIDNRNDIAVRVISNPNNENEKCIEVTFSNGEVFIEYVQYTHELWKMLNTPRLVRLETIFGARGAVEVDGYAERDCLARFICIYKKYFPVYAGKKNSIERFIRDYSKYSRELEKGNDAAHVNSFTGDNSFDNIMFMKHSTNQAMSDYIKWLEDGYDAYTAVNDRDEILLEFITPFRDSPLYIKFETPEDYADFQRTYISGTNIGGTKLTKKMQKVIYPTESGLAYQMTPIGMKAAGIVNKETVRSKEFNVWIDREHKNQLLSLPDEAFIVYHKGALENWLNHFLDGVKLPEEMKRGDRVFFPINGGGFGSVELVRKGRQKNATEDNTPAEMLD